MNILGISCYYHDAAAALVRDGRLVAAAHEERFTRKRHDAGFPTNAVQFCLREGKMGIGDVDYVGFYDKPLTKFDRMLQTYIATWPFSYLSFLKAMPVWINEKMWIPQTLRRELGYEGPVFFAEHHMSHAASAFFVSPFESAAIITLDGVGEWDTTTFGFGKGSEIRLLRTIRFPHSLGLFYSAFTYYLGFRVNSAEYKVMGLAPYGRPLYEGLIRENLIDLKADGSFRLSMKFFTYDRALRMTGRSFERLFGHPRREPESELTQFHKDVAASLQKVTDDAVLAIANHVHRETGLKNLCMAGGVALNCVANSRVLTLSQFQKIFIQPAAGDAGGAVGAAYYIHNSILGQERGPQMKDAFLGPSYDDSEISRFLDSIDAPYQRLGRSEMLEIVARLISDQNVVGWFQGRMEYGPRALGSRSILADARNPENWQRVNLKIKFRESFRPFAPAILEERLSDFFEFDRPSPYMLFVAPVKSSRRIEVPAVTHVDGSARLQTISRDQHELFYDLLAEFERQTGCPLVINTSFNIRGEPIVCSPADAYACFANTEMDFLAMGSYLIDKKHLKTLQRDESRQKVYQLD